MNRILGLLLAISITCAYTTYCEEAAYVFGESGSVKLDQYSLSEIQRFRDRDLHRNQRIWGCGGEPSVQGREI